MTLATDATYLCNDMTATNAETELSNLRRADEIHDRVVSLSRRLFTEGTVRDMDEFVRQAELLLQGVNNADVVLGIFDHNRYAPVIEVGDREFWGPMPTVPDSQRMHSILALLEPDYAAFPGDSVKWFSRAIAEIPFEHRRNLEFYHCGIAYRRTDGRPIRIFSKGVPIHYGADRSFTFTFNYVQNVHHLLKPSFRDYWIRIAYGAGRDLVLTLHSSDVKETAARDVLSGREKEILSLISAGHETKDIADRLDISVNTVGNHRSNMVQRLGARDTTALVQLAKMAGLI